jgi:hypothetical protein
VDNNNIVFNIANSDPSVSIDNISIFFSWTSCSNVEHSTSI